MKIGHHKPPMAFNILIKKNYIFCLNIYETEGFRN